MGVDVFISHASEDEEWASQLARQLRRLGLKAWDPSAEIAPGDNWALEIGRALEESGAMIVLLSPASAKSDSVKREIEYAITSKRFRERLIPVMVKRTTGFPWVLSQLQIEQGEPSDVAKRIAKRLRAVAASAN
jgi:hypothetical protein